MGDGTAFEMLPLLPKRDRGGHRFAGVSSATRVAFAVWPPGATTRALRLRCTLGVGSSSCFPLAINRPPMAAKTLTPRVFAIFRLFCCGSAALLLLILQLGSIQ